MRAGNVVSIRVNPTDTLSVIDLMKVLNMPMQTLSFPAMVSLALASSLQALREQGVIPERTGFEYNEMTAGILGTGQNKKKRAATAAIQSTGSELRPRLPERSDGLATVRLHPTATVAVDEAAGQLMFQNGTPSSAATPEEVISTEQRLARRRLSELNARKEMIEDGVQGLTWSTADQIEFDQLMKEVYG